MQVFKIARNGVTISELSGPDVDAAIRSGAVLPTDHYWTQGMSAWELVSQRTSWVVTSHATPPAVPAAQKPTPSTRPAMNIKGKVLDFNIANSYGLISGDDGIRYNFVGAEWRTQGVMPANGVRVEFVTSGSSATAIYATAQPVAASSGVFSRGSRKSRFVYILFAFFLGGWGVHNFYAGYEAKAKRTLIIGLIGIIIFPLLIFTAITALIDIFNVHQDANGVAFD